MAGDKRRRRFGSIRKRESGRYQVRYRGPDGVMRAAPETFERKSDADRYLALVEAQLLRHEWIDPARAQIQLSKYGERWISQRPGLRHRTVELYTWIFVKHIGPYLGNVPLSSLSTEMIRGWREELLKNGISRSMAAKSYRLLRAILMTAVKEDEILVKNPCRIPGADQEVSAERPILNIDQVYKLANVVPPRYRSFILLSTFACLRWGEVTALQRQHLNFDRGTVRVWQAFTEKKGVGLVLGPLKSRAGRREASVPETIFSAVQRHIDLYTSNAPAAYVFTGPAGRPLRRGSFNKVVRWREATAGIGVPGLHFHDLRHTGNTLAAATGASLRDLMARMGHDNPRAALIYQHATSQADRAIAEALNSLLKSGSIRDSDGTDLL